jgi:hypothetical protein
VGAAHRDNAQANTILSAYRENKKGWVPPAPVASDFQYVPREAYMKALEPLIQLLAEIVIDDILKEESERG